jgi:nucleoside-diphosphate-sugar epimerase
MFVVTGATGNVGGAVVRALAGTAGGCGRCPGGPPPRPGPTWSSR